MRRESIEARRRRRKRDAVRGVALFAALQLIAAAVIASLCFIPGEPPWLAALFGVTAAFTLAMVIPALVVLKKRFQEIEGGELDVAAEY